jgi:hypothetical protein
MSAFMEAAAFEDMILRQVGKHLTKYKKFWMEKDNAL